MDEKPTKHRSAEAFSLLAGASEAGPLFAQILDATPDLYACYDLDLRFLWVNRAFEVSSGFCLKDIAGRVCHEILYQSNEPCPDCPVIAAKAAGEVREGEMSTPDGRCWLLRACPIKDECGRIASMLAVGQDITARKRMEVQLLESQKRLDTIGSRSQAMIFLWRVAEQWPVEYASQNVIQLGYSAEEFVSGSISWAGIIHPEDVAQLKADIARKIEKGIDEFVHTYRLIARSGEIRWVEDSKVILRDPEGKPIHAQGILLDVTDRKNAESALLEREQKLASIFRAAPVGIGMVIDRVIQEANDRLCYMTGYPREEMIGRNSRFLYPAQEEYDRVGNLKYTQISASGTGTVETRWLRKDGDIIHVLLSSTPLENADLMKGVTFTALDITDRRRSEDALREKTAELDYYFNNALDLFCIADMQGHFRRLNPQWQTMLGYALEDLEGKAYIEFVHPDDVEATLEATSRLRNNEAILGFTNRYRCKDGTYRWVEWRSFASDNLIYAAARDITERKQAEAERLEMERRILHTQKLESLGILAGGIAHDFNNLLMAILGNLDLALKDLPPRSSAQSCVAEAARAAGRAAELTRQMLAYSGKGQFVIQELDLSELVRENAHMLRAAITRNVSLDLNLHDHPPPISADPGQMQQIIMNLITNASEAIGDQAGTVILSTGIMPCDAAYLSRSRLEIKPSPGEFVWLEVEDHGCGMDHETQHRLFDPFFTTKFTGRGLGMSAVLGIVRGHKGAVLVDSAPGEGTRIRVLFPASSRGRRLDRAEEAGARVSQKPSGSARSEAILVVDDDEAVLEVSTRMLKRFGFKPLKASDGEEAVRTYRENTELIKVVVLDLTMPRMDGVATFEALRAVNPDVRVVLSSGYSEQDAVRRFLGQGLAGFIQKPYQAADLLESVEKALKSPGKIR